MKNLNFAMIIGMITGMLVLSSCAMRSKILDVSAVSMTRSHLNPGEKLQETGPVSGQYCSDTFGDRGAIGLIDECVKSAQSQSGVDYILNASIWAEGRCVTVEGTGAKVASSGGTMSTTTTPPSNAAPMKKSNRKKRK